MLPSSHPSGKSEIVEIFIYRISIHVLVYVYGNSIRCYDGRVYEAVAKTLCKKSVAYSEKEICIAQKNSKLCHSLPHRQVQYVEGLVPVVKDGYVNKTLLTMEPDLCEVPRPEWPKDLSQMEVVLNSVLCFL